MVDVKSPAIFKLILDPRQAFSLLQILKITPPCQNNQLIKSSNTRPFRLDQALLVQRIPGGTFQVQRRIPALFYSKVEKKRLLNFCRRFLFLEIIPEQTEPCQPSRRTGPL